MSPGAVALSPASQTASSPSTLWAQPSKEWVVPARPKPGRKRKEETNAGPAASKNDLIEVSSGRRVQNRAAQRAFRERKQTQLAELQARLHSYEQGEIERNVALQNIAKKTKDDNEELRKENQMLREKITRLEQERDELLYKERKRAHDDTSMSSPHFPLSDSSTAKRAKINEDEQEDPPSSLLSSFASPSSSLVSSPNDTAPAGGVHGGHDNHSRHSVFPTPSPANSLSAVTLNNQDIVEPLNCVLCSADAPCVCRQMAVERVTDNSSSLLHHPCQNEGISMQSTVSLDQSVRLGSPPVTGVSILDGLPAFQAPVPIRRRTGTSRVNPVFPVAPVATSSSSSVQCSGDPDNCMACADDSFGKAFCQAIGHTLNSTLPCADCPKRTNQMDEILVSGCCGDVSECGSCGIAPIISSATSSHCPETMPTNDAWRRLKSHPSLAFEDLTLLAEVVARRSKCTGSRVVISPAPGPATPDHATLRPHHEPIPAREDQSVLLSDARGRFCQKQTQREPPPQLVPQHVLIECGRRRMREVNTDGVREALRLLDQKFAHTR